MEGTYVFPLPEDAAVSSFDMWVDGKKFEGKLLGRDEARRIYEDIVRQQKDPALLEYIGRGAFQARIFPIPARRASHRAGVHAGAGAAGRPRALSLSLNTEKFSARPLSEVAISVDIQDRADLRAIYSPSHPVQVAREAANHATVGYEGARRAARP